MAGENNGWDATFHRHFGSNEIHRDGGAECTQQGTPYTVYVFDPDFLAEHDAAVEAAVRADQIEKDMQIARDESHDEPGTEWGEGFEQAQYAIERRIRAQLSVPVTPGGER